ncbi:hypothetical protein FGIG_08151 [Fasciola gigantica]|uniref:Uncharacterized protein n=1 Tax=Fasciola gigantica TaxID=46835 RepID=A0A504Y8W1_FASGI|nr:hypothetical protein FGIG_08151 [Fasciola gigantica]
MAETAPPETDKSEQRSGPRKLLEERIKGDVKWFNVKSGYGFIIVMIRTLIIVHQSGNFRRITLTNFSRSFKEREKKLNFTSSRGRRAMKRGKLLVPTMLLFRAVTTLLRVVACIEDVIEE